MNLCIFFEGTGQGVEGQITNVTRMQRLCVEAQDSQLTHLESGPGTRAIAQVGGYIMGTDWRVIFRSARRWFEANYKRLPAKSSVTKVYLFGFSRGALLARHFASWLDKLNIGVSYLGLWDTVDSTLGLDVPKDVPQNVYACRHAVARDEARRFFDYVPIKSDIDIVEEMLFPGSHSDIGGLYDDDHQIADLTLNWIAEGAQKAGVLLKNDIGEVDLDFSKVILHDSSLEANNLWGALDLIKRKVSGLSLHKRCFGL